jgi:hypothetical protein
MFYKAVPKHVASIIGKLNSFPLPNLINQIEW